MNRMKNLASCLILFFINSIVSAQITAEHIYNSWEKNSGGKKAVQINYDQGTGAISDTTTLTINAKIQRICYSEYTIFIKTQGLPERGPSFIDAEPGTYIEDYEYSWSNGGHLDQHNGRFCKTPEFPNGIYAYFVTMDQAYTAQFPFYIGTTYYGTPYEYNYLSNPTDQTIPDHATCSIITGTVENLYKEITLFPNPTDAGFRIEFDEAPELVQVFSVSGKLVKNVNVPHQSNYYDFGDEFSSGIYQIVLKYKNASYTKKVVIE